MTDTSFLSDEDYRHVYSLVPRLCVDLVIWHEGKVLLARRMQEPFRGLWHLPGGRVQFRESVSGAAHRIAKRELKVDIQIRDFPRPLGYIEFPHDKGDLGDFHSVSIVLYAESKATFDSPDLRWFSQATGEIHPIQLDFLLEKNIIKKEKQS